MPDTNVDSGAAPPTSNIVGLLDPTADEMRKDSILKGEQKLTEQKIGAEAGMAREEQRRSDAYRSRMEGMITREQASADELKPWNAEQELASRKTNLWDQFGSPGFVISMLASAFTAYPMNSALNAGAASMNAINQGDMKSFEIAHQAWKDNADLTVKRLNMEHQQFADIDHLRQTDMAEWRVRAQILAEQFNDQRKLLLLKNGMDEDYFKARDAEIQSAQQLATANGAITENYALMSTLNGHVAQPGEPVTHKDAKGTPMAGGDERWYKQTDPMAAYSAAYKQLQEAKYAGRFSSFGAQAQKVRTTEEVEADVAKEHPDWSKGQVALEAQRRLKAAQSSVPEKTRSLNEIKEDLRKQHSDWSEGQLDKEAHRQLKESESVMTANKKYELQAHLGLYDDAVKIIDQVTDTLDRYVGAAGLPGRATRLTERIRNLAGADQTDRVQMARDIQQLQLMAPQLLLDRTTGRPLSAEHELIEGIIAGLSIGDTTANTLRAMKEVRDRLITIRDRDRARIGGEGAQLPVESQPSSSHTPNSWDYFPHRTAP